MGLDPSVAAVRLAVRRSLPGHRGTVVVACSGGADSLALLAATIFEARHSDLRVVGATVDHGLQARSAQQAEHVVVQMAQLGVDETASVRVAVEASGQGPEAAAREARYAVLEELAERFDTATVLLGHTRDDQAETVLLGLARGSGARSLSGMRRGFGVFRRPLLDVTRDQTEAACRAEGITWWEDPHNTDPRFLRARVRHRVLPVLEEELGPGVAAALSRTADLLADDAAALDGLAEDLRDAALRDGGLDTTVLAGWPVAIVTRVVRAALVQAGCPASELTRGHVLAVVGLEPGKQAQLPGRVVAFLEGDLLRYGRTAVAG